MRPALGAALLAVGVGLASCSGAATSNTAASTAGVVLWPAPLQDVSARAQVAGVPVLPGEVLTYHVHAHLDVFVNGQAVVVPASIGIDYVARAITPLHTHDASGIIHVESAAPVTFTLGQFFTEWGVTLDSQCVATYCRPATTIQVTVNGVAFTGNPADVIIHPQDEITVVVGSPPAATPTGFAFPPGY